jgi:hypothetical protein
MTIMEREESFISQPGFLRSGHYFLPEPIESNLKETDGGSICQKYYGALFRGSNILADFASSK